MSLNMWSPPWTVHGSLKKVKQKKRLSRRLQDKENLEEDEIEVRPKRSSRNRISKIEKKSPQNLSMVIFSLHLRKIHRLRIQVPSWIFHIWPKNLSEILFSAWNFRRRIQPVSYLYWWKYTNNWIWLVKNKFCQFKQKYVFCKC